MRIPVLCCAACALTGCLVFLAIFSSKACGQEAKLQLDANDVSFLWPLPTTANDVSQLISADQPLADGQTQLWPAAIFQRVLSTIPSVSVVATSGSTMKIVIPPDLGFDKLPTWRIAGIRIDPSAPGCDDKFIKVLGSTPQIRIVLQPVTVSSNTVTVHDFAAHLAFDFVTHGGALDPTTGKITPAVPDTDTFRLIVNDLTAIKKNLKSRGVETNGSLGVHPGFSDRTLDLTGQLRALLVKHLRIERLNNVAFMGVRRPEPWIFFLMRRQQNDFQVVPQGAARNSPAIMFFAQDPQQVVPEPTPRMFDPFGRSPFGVSTAVLLRSSPEMEGDATAVDVPGLGRRPKIKEIADIIANPHISHLLNADCISCHTESSCRNTLNLPPASVPFAYARKDGLDAVKSEFISTDPWNVRNFGWGVIVSTASPTAAVRTGNEAAESAAFINREYINKTANGPTATLTTTSPATALGSTSIAATASPKPVASSLNLIMTAKSDQDYIQLKGLIAGLQALPPERNPIAKALEGIGLVHDARFVFLQGNQIAVITTFDGDFDRYIDLFVDEIGDVFNLILPHIKDAPAGDVTKDKRDEFHKFLQDNNVPPAGAMYSAYPDLTVQAIKALKRQASNPH